MTTRARFRPLTTSLAAVAASFDHVEDLGPYAAGIRRSEDLAEGNRHTAVAELVEAAGSCSGSPVAACLAGHLVVVAKQTVMRAICASAWIPQATDLAESRKATTAQAYPQG